MTTTARQPASVPLLPGEDPNVVYPEEEKVPESELQGNARHYVQSALSIRYQEQPRAIAYEKLRCQVRYVQTVEVGRTP